MGVKASDDGLDWREGPDDNLVFAFAIAAWEAKRTPGRAELTALRLAREVLAFVPRLAKR